MDHVRILKRAWHILWNYRVLWIFGFILALTAASWSSSGPSYSVGSGDFQERRLRDVTPGKFKDDLERGLDDFGRGLADAIEEFEDFFEEGIRSSTVDTILAIAIGMLIFLFLLFIVGRMARFVAEAAIIRMVDRYEETGERLSFRAGFRLGWSRTAWRLFLINLVVDLPVLIAFGFLFLIAFVPLFLWGIGVISLGVVGTVGALGLFFVWILALIVVSAILNLLKHFFRRACAIEQLGVIDSIQRGYHVVRENLKDVGLMWLIMLGISLGWPMVLFPAVLIVGMVALVIGGGIFLVVAGLGRLLVSGVMPLIVAGVLAFPVFLLVFIAPLGFVGGLRETFVSSTWTLTYREVAAFEHLEPERMESLPEPEDELEGDQLGPGDEE